MQVIQQSRYEVHVNEKLEKVFNFRTELHLLQNVDKGQDLQYFEEFFFFLNIHISRLNNEKKF